MSADRVTVRLAGTTARHRRANPRASRPITFDVDRIWWNGVVRQYRRERKFGVQGRDLRSVIYFALKAAQQ